MLIARLRPASRQYLASVCRKYKFNEAEGLYFISFATVGWVDVFTRREYKDIVVASLRVCQENKGLRLFEWVLMNSHVHMLALSQLPQPTTAQTGYCTVFGDQFRDENGDDFFPMMMNYYVDYACYNVFLDATPPDPTPAQIAHFKLCQTSLYGQDGVYDYSPISKGPQRILQDFYEMSNLGFNTVRVIMTPFKMDPVVGFKLAIKHFPSGQNEVLMNLDPPNNATNPLFMFHMEQVLAVCSLANVVGLKILLITADGHEVFNGNAGSVPVDDYRDLLIGIAEYIHARDVHNLFGYDLYGEPSLAEEDLDAYHTKDEICAVVEEWNTALKEHDPDHLTTIGGDMWGNGTWQLALMDADGREILKQPFASRTAILDLRTLASGSYTLLARSAELTLKERLLKP